MKKYLYFPVIFSIVIFSGCSKDKMLEKRISKKDGEWNIEQVDWTLVYQTSGGQVVRTGTTYDAGTFTFDKDNGKYSYTVDTFQRAGNFNWGVDNQTVNIVQVSQTFDFNSSTFVQTALALSGTETDKGSAMSLSGSDVDQEVGNSVKQFALSGTFYLKKK